MPLTFVKVVGPANRDVFVNGNFIEAAGQTQTVFRVETGQNTFFLLDANDGIEAERTQDCPAAPRDNPVIVDLAPAVVGTPVVALRAARGKPAAKQMARRAPPRAKAKAKPAAKAKAKAPAKSKPKAKRRAPGRKS